MVSFSYQSALEHPGGTSEYHPPSKEDGRGENNEEEEFEGDEEQPDDHDGDQNKSEGNTLTITIEEDDQDEQGSAVPSTRSPLPPIPAFPSQKSVDRAVAGLRHILLAGNQHLDKAADTVNLEERVMEIIKVGDLIKDAITRVTKTIRINKKSRINGKMSKTDLEDLNRSKSLDGNKEDDTTQTSSVPSNSRTTSPKKPRRPESSSNVLLLKSEEESDAENEENEVEKEQLEEENDDNDVGEEGGDPDVQINVHDDEDESDDDDGDDQEAIEKVLKKRKKGKGSKGGEEETGEGEDGVKAEKKKKTKKSASSSGSSILGSKAIRDDLSSDDEKQSESVIDGKEKRKSKPSKSEKRKKSKTSSTVSKEKSEEKGDKPIKKSKSKGSGKKSSKAKKRSKAKSGNDVDIDENSDADEDQDESSKSRKKIRKIMGSDKLTDSTKSAAKSEKERWERLKDKQKRFNGLEINDENESVTTRSGGMDGPGVIRQIRKGPTFKRVVLDTDGNDQALIQVDPALVKHLKEHQGYGLKFMFDSAFESVDRFLAGDTGGGCILAHCMGLGKTFQCVTFLHTVLTNRTLSRPPKTVDGQKVTPMSRALVLAPVNAILTWDKEFKKWLGPNVAHNVNHCVLKTAGQRERVEMLNSWMNEGGVLIMGYTLFRTLVNFIPKSSKGVSKRVSEDHLKVFQSALLDPGPDLVVCDEGHQLKNDKAQITKAVAQIKTRRRICLTGTPLQNHLEEYYTMVDFVKPGLLGNKKEFKNRFENPIKNGQYIDSSEEDVKRMKSRAYCLHKELDQVVQRRDYNVLAPYLPEKREYIIFTRLTDKQRELYQVFLEKCVGATDLNSLQARGNHLMPDSHQFGRICSHPYTLIQHAKDKKEGKADDEELLNDGIKSEVDEDNESSDEDGQNNENGDPWNDGGSDGSDGEEKKNGKSSKKRRSGIRGLYSNEDEVIPVSRRRGPAAGSEDLNDIVSGWWENRVTDKDQYDVQLSTKLILLFEIIKKCEIAGDKLLIFSQSLMSLNIIENFLKYYNNNQDKWFHDHELKGKKPEEEWGWFPGTDYYRLDGRIPADSRKRMQDLFNDPKNSRGRVFLISTKAGSLGIDLIGANRVIIFDCCWNPSHDTQSIFRVYRFGQLKPCYIYRLVSQGSMEEVIYRRQVTKMSVQLRVVDAAQIARHYAANDLEQLYNFNPDSIPTGAERRSHIRQFVPPEDIMLRELLMDKGEWISRIQEHDSLLVHQENETLTAKEREEAWADYEILRESGVDKAGAQLSSPAWYQLVIVTLTQSFGKPISDKFFQVCNRWLQYGNKYLQYLPAEQSSGITDLGNQFCTFLKDRSDNIEKIMEAYNNMKELVTGVVTLVECARNPNITSESVKRTLAAACGEFNRPTPPISFSSNRMDLGRKSDWMSSSNKSASSPSPFQDYIQKSYK